MAKQGKRGNSEGTIFWREDRQCWAGAVSLGYKTNGQRNRPTVYGKTQKEVIKKRNALLQRHEQGLPVAMDRQTVQQFLETWLRDVVRPNLRAKTYRSYEQLVRVHLLPLLGHHQVAKLTPQHVQAVLTAAREAGKSPTTVQRIRDVLRNALNQAMKWELVTRNVAMLVDAPRVARKEVRPLTVEQARWLLKMAQGDRLEALYFVALSCGLREGEILGLRWEDIDLAEGTLRVTVALQMVGGKPTLAEPKTERSRRTLIIGPTLIAALHGHKARQLEARLKAGAEWEDTGLVFTTRTGKPLSPRNLVRDFKKLLKRAGLPDVRFHDLRHSSTSLLAAEGIDARTRMQILGHSDIRTTENIYTHVFDKETRHAADVMEHLFRDLEQTG